MTLTLTLTREYVHGPLQPMDEWHPAIAGPLSCSHGAGRG